MPLSGSGPRVLGHRGASGYQVENTLTAFREARSRGADGVELDLHCSADGAFIVHHDPDLAGVGPIASLSLDRIRRFRLIQDEPVPTLEEALAELAGLEVWVELKQLPSERDPALLTILEGTDPALVGVHSFDHRVIARLGARRPLLRRGILSASYPVDLLSPLKAAGATALWQQWQLIDRPMVDQLHEVGGEVIAWTVPDPAAARHLAALGVDALCGNYPDQLRIG
jgi:glycerophosphoryl diester phosphodiesterase